MNTTTAFPFDYDAYLRLMRLNRPVGTLLLLWPTLAALWIAAKGWPGLDLTLIFTLGTFVMRSAGCVINDYADRHVDAQVKRTKDRPLATGELGTTHALVLFCLLCTIAFVLVLMLSRTTQIWAVGGLAIACFYPFMKRWTYLPQVALGAAFSWGMILAFAEISGEVHSEAWLLFTSSLLWIVAYDTMYAMVDRDDDLKIGVKSTAILFGNADRLMVGILQLSCLAGLWMLGTQLGYRYFYFAGLAVMAGLFAYQQVLIRHRSRDECFAAFRNNIWAGFALFAGVMLELLLADTVAAELPW